MRPDPPPSVICPPPPAGGLSFSVLPASAVSSFICSCNFFIFRRPSTVSRFWSIWRSCIVFWLGFRPLFVLYLQPPLLLFADLKVFEASNSPIAPVDQNQRNTEHARRFLRNEVSIDTKQTESHAPVHWRLGNIPCTLPAHSEWDCQCEGKMKSGTYEKWKQVSLLATEPVR